MMLKMNMQTNINNINYLKYMEQKENKNEEQKQDLEREEATANEE